MVSPSENHSNPTLVDLVALFRGDGDAEVVAAHPAADNAGATLDETALTVPVAAVRHDSRGVRPGDLYVALPGTRVHGATFAGQVAAAGAAAIVTDAAGLALIRAAEPGRPDLPVIVVPSPRRAMALAAALVQGRPAERLLTFAVTGTNGKTTTTFLLEAMLGHLRRSVATIGTIGFRHDGAALQMARTTVTTPESSELQELLATFVRRGADTLAMEVSSHAMVLHRADAITFDVAAFTNLGRDHLDFHSTMEEYFEAKASLFTADHARAAVVNIDDEWGRRLATRIAETGELRLLTTGWQNPDADYRVLAGEHQRVRLATPHGELAFTLGLPGDFNVRNAATALAMADLAGLDVTAAAAGLAGVQVPGRMQRVALEATGGHRPPGAIVDFAHTPQAVASALEALAPLRRDATLVTVVGCGGDRDVTKREPMGAAAAAGSDLVVITDDNPRTEDPALIRATTLAGARAELGRLGRPEGDAVDGGDRRSAINLALRLAGPGGTIAVLGKGHEQGQEMNGTIAEFDDVAVIGQEWLVVTSDETGSSNQ